MKTFTSQTQLSGKIGEDVAVLFLVKRGYSIIERNYTCRLGEIDIITEKDGVFHFVEVKSLRASHNAPIESLYNPLENITPQKLQKIERTVETWLRQQYNISRETPYYIDALAVYVDEEKRKARVQVIEHINS